MSRTPFSWFRIAILVLVTITLAADGRSLAQERPTAGSPRMLAIGHFNRIVSSPAEELDDVLAQAIAPSLRDRLGAGPLRAEMERIRTALATATPAGARPVSDVTVELMYNFAAGSGSVTLSLEPQPPHRLTDVSAKFPDLTTPARTVRGVDDFEDAIGAYLDRLAAEGEFSGSVVAAIGDRTVFAKSYGFADRRTSRANTLATPISVGSMNKMFTGLAFGQLLRDGRVQLDDKVGTYLPDYPNAAVREQVTIHQLLTHTSGIPSYWNDAWEARKDEISTVAETIKTFATDPLTARPGTEFLYSNGGPTIAGRILEVVTGQSYYDYIREHIYAPAGMTHSAHYLMTDRTAGFAIGYHRETPDEPFVPNTDMMGLRGSPAGGGYASADDLLRFSKALADGRLLSREWLERIWNPRRDGPESANYCYLWGTGVTNGKRWVGHNGGAPGVSADFRYFPDDGITVIVLGNQSGVAMGVSGWLVELLTKTR